VALTKLSITEEEVELIKELLSKNMTGAKIAKKLKMSQPKMWRNMEILGLNNKKKCKPKKPKKEKMFSWSSFKNNSLI